MIQDRTLNKLRHPKRLSQDRILGYILILIFLALPAQGWTKVTNLVDFNVTVEGDKVVYTGRVLWFKDDQPAVVRVMLMGAEGQVFDEAITSQDGRYRLVGQREDLLVMVQPVHTRRLPLPEQLDLKEITKGELPASIQKIAKEIEKVFPKANYGYYPIITSPKSKVIFEEGKAFLLFNKGYNFHREEDVLNKGSFECFDVAYAIREYLFEKHRNKLVGAYLCSTNLSEGYNHVLTYAIFREPGDKDKFYKILFDGTPLNETLNPQVLQVSADVRYSHDSDFQQFSHKRELAKGLPLKFIKCGHRGFYIMAHLSLHDGICEYGFTILDISPGTQKECLKVHQKVLFSYGFRDLRLKDIQKEFKKIKPIESVDGDNLKRCGIIYTQEGEISEEMRKACKEVIANTFYWLVQKTLIGAR